MTGRYRITVDGVTYDVEVGDVSASPVTVVVDGVEFKVDLPDVPQSQRTVKRTQRSTTRPISRRPAKRAQPSAAVVPDSQDVLRAPMPGRIIRVNVSVGDNVQRGQSIVVLESMKMENTIAAPRDGVVSQVHIATDESVQHGQSLVELE